MVLIEQGGYLNKSIPGNYSREEVIYLLEAND